MADLERQNDEILALKAIFHDEDTIETAVDGDGRYCGQMIIAPHLPADFKLRIVAENGGQGLQQAPREYQIDFLPPFVLGFHLPPDYPSRRPPAYTICSRWATMTQLSELCRHLDHLWHANELCEILFVWSDFLRADALIALGIKDSLELACQQAGTGLDGRAIRDAPDDAAAATAVIEHDERRRRERFDRAVFTCGVCLQERAGAGCLRYGTCTSHTFCRECAKRHLTVRISEGDVLGVTCPAGSCPARAHPAQVKELVSPELFDKYERLLLQTTLATMTDIVYCPRPHCQMPVLREGESNMASCAGCQFVFCCLCRMAFHGVSPCSIGGKMSELRQQLLNATPEEREVLEQRYGKQVVKRVLEESHAQQWIEDNCKRCPHCNSSIQKDDGCNKMTCYKCHSYFCWLCGQRLPKVNPYSHYSDSKCALFPLNWTDREENAGADQEDAGFVFLQDPHRDDDVVEVDWDVDSSEDEEE